MITAECLDCKALAYDGAALQHNAGCEGAEERGNVRYDRCPYCFVVLDPARLDLLDPSPPDKRARERQPAPFTPPAGSEAAIQRAVIAQYGALPALRLFRNSIGLARDVRTGQHIRFGLARGSSDLIGLVAPHGRFLAAEVKSARGVVTEEQQAFLEMVARFGGTAGVVRSTEEMAALVRSAQRSGT